MGALQGPRSSLPLHPLGTGAALEPTHRHSCSDWASFPVQFHSPVLLSVCLSVWITGRPVGLFLGNILVPSRLPYIIIHKQSLITFAGMCSVSVWGLGE